MMIDLSWVMRNLWSNGGRRKVELNIPDTLVVDKDRNVQWFFTGKSGDLLKKSQKTVGKTPLEKALHTFCKAASSREACDPVLDTAAHVFYSTGKRKKLSVAEMELGQLDDDIVILQQAVCPQEGDHVLICEYKLDGNGKTFSTTISGTHKDNRGIAREVDQVAGKVAKQIYTNTNQTIVKMTIHFIIHEEKVWMTHISTIALASIETTTEKMTSSAPPTHKRKKDKKTFICAGQFCDYSPEQEMQWLAKQEHAPVNVFPELEDTLTKISYRSIVLAQERHTLTFMDPLLESWTKRRQAAKSKLRSIIIDEPSASKMPYKHSKGIGIIFQTSKISVSWRWTGNIDHINLSLVPAVGHEDGRALGDMLLPHEIKHQARNGGRADVFIPAIHPNWESRIVFWNFVVSAESVCSDIPLEGISVPFILGGPDGQVPVINASELKYLPKREPTQRKEQVPDDFNDVHNLVNYHRTAKVCSRCVRVYKTLDAARIAKRDSQEMQKKKKKAHTNSLPVFWAPSEQAEGTQTEAKSKPQEEKRSIFKRLSEPKISKGEEFVGLQSWGAGFDLRNKKPQQKPVKMKRKKGASNTSSSGANIQIPVSSNAKSSTPLKSSRRKKKKDVISKPPTTIEKEQRPPVPHHAPEKSLDLKTIKQSSSLHQVLCLLALGQLEDSKMMINLVEKRGLESLAYSSIEQGRIIVKEAPAKPLTRSKRGRQTIQLLSHHLEICHMFVYFMGEQQTTVRESLLIERAGNAAKSIQEFARIHKVAKPRAHIMQGGYELLLSNNEQANEEWKQAVAVATRTEGMWSYNVAAAHFLIGKNSESASIREQHLSAARAIFSRIDEEYEVSMVHKKQEDAIPDTPETIVATPKPLSPERVEDELPAITPNDRTLPSPSPLDEGTPKQQRVRKEHQEILKWARGVAQQVRQKLHSEKLLPVYIDKESTELIECSQQVQRLLEAAEADIEIFATTKPKHKHYNHRKGRIKDALDLVEYKTGMLEQLQQQQAYSRPSTFTSTTSSTAISSSPSEDDDNSDPDDEQNLPVSTQQLFEACALRHGLQMKHMLKRWTNQMGGSPTEATDSHGNTLLHNAALDNWIQGIHTCLSCGIDINAQNDSGHTALDLASSHGNDTAQTLLIALGGC